MDDAALLEDLERLRALVQEARGPTDSLQILRHWMHTRETGDPMPLSIKKMQEEVRTITFRFLSEDVKVTYRLGAMGANLSDWVKDHGSDTGALRDMVEKVVTSWDVTDEDGTVIPATRAAIEQYDIPTPFLNAVFEAVYADATPGELKKLSYGGRASPTRT